MESEEDLLEHFSEDELLSPSSAKVVEIVEVSSDGRFSRFNEEIAKADYKLVYRAIDNDTGCEVAWNSIKTSNLTPAENEKIRNEVAIILRLNHPNIVHFIKAWHNREKQEVVFVTEIMTGGSLREYLKRIKSPHLRVIKQWCKGILNGLSYLHSQKPYPIVHRNINSENIFVSSSTGDVRIGDLGHSTFMDTSYHSCALGSPNYSAPELFEGKYGPSVDVYAFGVVVLEMVTRRLPFWECRTLSKIYKKKYKGEDPLDLARVLDPEIKEFIQACLLPVDQRPLADELLNHRFLQIDEKNQKAHMPLSIMSAEDLQNILPQIKALKKKPKKTKINNDSIVTIELVIGLCESENLRRQKIQFEYDLSRDSPKLVAQELVDQFKLNPKYQKEIKKLISKKVRGKSTSNFCPEDLSPIEHVDSPYDRSLQEELQGMHVPEFPGVLKQGTQSQAVKTLQVSLESYFNTHIDEEGVFGKATQKLVKKFQKQNMLPVSGNVNKKVWDSLFRRSRRNTYM